MSAARRCFTLGLGDIVPMSTAARVLLVIEAGSGFGFLTVGIAYLPVVYQAFSRREAQITLLDAWAGSPPAATELLRRLAAADAVPDLSRYLLSGSAGAATFSRRRSRIRSSRISGRSTPASPGSRH